MKDIKNKIKLTAEDLPLPVRCFYENQQGEPALRMATTIASIICYQAQAPRLRVRYPYDNKDNMLLCNLLVIGHTGSGKSQVMDAVKLLTTGPREEDQRQRRLLQQAQEANKRKSSQQDKDEEPLVCIRMLQHFTLPIVCKYSDQQLRKYGEQLGFLLTADELGTLCETKRSKLDLQAVSRTAYSLGEEFVKDTLYVDGYNAIVDIVWNSVLLGQEAALSDYITKKGLLCGDGARQILIKVGNELAPKAPVFQPLSAEQQQAVDEAIQKLKQNTYTVDGKLQPTHLINMQWLYPDIEDWCEEQRYIITKSGSRSLEAFHVRASVSAFRLCAMLYYLWGEQPEHQEQVRKCYLYFAQKILDSQMEQWGQDYEAALPKPKEKQDKPRIFDVMPESFTKEQLKEKIAELELKTEARQFLYKWRRSNWIYYEQETKLFHKMYEV